MNPVDREIERIFQQKRGLLAITARYFLAHDQETTILGAQPKLPKPTEVDKTVQYLLRKLGRPEFTIQYLNQEESISNDGTESQFLKKITSKFVPDDEPVHVRVDAGRITIDGYINWANQDNPRKSVPLSGLELVLFPGQTDPETRRAITELYKEYRTYWQNIPDPFRHEPYQQIQISEEQITITHARPELIRIIEDASTLIIRSRTGNENVRLPLQILKLIGRSMQNTDQRYPSSEELLPVPI